MPDSKHVLVLPAIPSATPYTYKTCASQNTEVGTIVMVDIRGKLVTGIVLQLLDNVTAKYPIKAITHVPDVPPLKASQIKFLQWVAKYTLFPIGSVLKLSLGSGFFFQHIPRQKSYKLAQNLKNLSQKRKSIVPLFQDHDALSMKELQDLSTLSDTTLRTMIKDGQLLEHAASTAQTAPRHYSYSPMTLSKEQKQAADLIHPSISQSCYKTFLLDGVTGSGKTAVYLTCAAEVFSHNKQVLILLPEIALTQQTLQRFAQVFNSEPATWHSQMTKSQKNKAWQAVANGEARVIIGARSAIFLPFHNLGMIIVDEEHDGSYKQEEGVIYNARDMAIVKASIDNIPIILASATPSLESYLNAKEGKYQYLQLKSRHANASMPLVHVVDMRTHNQKNHWISDEMQQAICHTLEQKQQALLFLNRRGYAPLTLCKKCGHRMQCPKCNAWLVARKNTNSLSCHHCQYKRLQPQQCPQCECLHSFVPCGPGVERIAEEASKLFPNARVAIIDSDSANNVQNLSALLEDIHQNKIDIIIGTQMIAKGHHFPKITLVGIIDADLGLSGEDLRANEKTFQLLHQVSGRSGREQDQGLVYIQTFNPQHMVIQALQTQNKEDFYNTEAENRKLLQLPPFGRLASIVLSGLKEDKVKLTAINFVRLLPVNQGFITLGPVPCNLAKLRSKYRWRILLKSPKTHLLQDPLHQFMKTFQYDKSVKITIDVDPHNFF